MNTQDATLVMVLLRVRTNHSICWFSVDDIAKRTKLTKQQVTAVLDRLDRGWIEVRPGRRLKHHNNPADWDRNFYRLTETGHRESREWLTRHVH